MFSFFAASILAMPNSERIDVPISEAMEAAGLLAADPFGDGQPLLIEGISEFNPIAKPDDEDDFLNEGMIIDGKPSIRQPSKARREFMAKAAYALINGGEAYVSYDDGKLSVLDGSHVVAAAAARGDAFISAIVGEPPQKIQWESAIRKLNLQPTFEKRNVQPFYAVCDGNGAQRDDRAVAEGIAKHELSEDPDFLFECVSINHRAWLFVDEKHLSHAAQALPENSIESLSLFFERFPNASISDLPFPFDFDKAVISWISSGDYDKAQKLPFSQAKPSVSPISDSLPIVKAIASIPRSAWIASKRQLSNGTIPLYDFMKSPAGHQALRVNPFLLEIVKSDFDLALATVLSDSIDSIPTFSIKVGSTHLALAETLVGDDSAAARSFAALSAKTVRRFFKTIVEATKEKPYSLKTAQILLDKIPEAYFDIHSAFPNDDSLLFSYILRARSPTQISKEWNSKKRLLNAPAGFRDELAKKNPALFSICSWNGGILPKEWLEAPEPYLLLGSEFASANVPQATFELLKADEDACLDLVSTNPKRNFQKLPKENRTKSISLAALSLDPTMTEDIPHSLWLDGDFLLKALAIGCKIVIPTPFLDDERFVIEYLKELDSKGASIDSIPKNHPISAWISSALSSGITDLAAAFQSMTLSHKLARTESVGKKIKI